MSLRSSAKEMRRGASSAELPDFPSPAAQRVPGCGKPPPVRHLPEGYGRVRGSAGRKGALSARDSGPLRLWLPLPQGGRPVRSTRDARRPGLSGKGVISRRGVEPGELIGSRESWEEVSRPSRIRELSLADQDAETTNPSSAVARREGGRDVLAGWHPGQDGHRLSTQTLRNSQLEGLVTLEAGDPCVCGPAPRLAFLLLLLLRFLLLFLFRLLLSTPSPPSPPPRRVRPTALSPRRDPPACPPPRAPALGLPRRPPRPLPPLSPPPPSGRRAPGRQESPGRMREERRSPAARRNREWLEAGLRRAAAAPACCSGPHAPHPAGPPRRTRRELRGVGCYVIVFPPKEWSLEDGGGHKRPGSSETLVLAAR